MTNDEMIIIIRRWTVHFFMNEWEVGVGVRVNLKLGAKIAHRIINYQTMDDAIRESFYKTRNIVMAVCGDIERSRPKDES